MPPNSHLADQFFFRVPSVNYRRRRRLCRCLCCDITQTHFFQHKFSAFVQFSSCDFRIIYCWCCCLLDYAHTCSTTCTKLTVLWNTAANTSITFNWLEIDFVSLCVTFCVYIFWPLSCLCAYMYCFVCVRVYCSSHAMHEAYTHIHMHASDVLVCHYILDSTLVQNRAERSSSRLFTILFAFLLSSLLLLFVVLFGSFDVQFARMTESSRQQLI